MIAKFLLLTLFFATNAVAAQQCANFFSKSQTPNKIIELKSKNIIGIFAEIGAGQEASAKIFNHDGGKIILDSVSAYDVNSSNGRYDLPPNPEIRGSYVSSARLHQQLNFEFKKLQEDPPENRSYFVLSNTVQTSRTGGRAWIGVKLFDLVSQQTRELIVEVFLKEESSKAQRDMVGEIGLSLLHALTLHPHNLGAQIKEFANNINKSAYAIEVIESNLTNSAHNLANLLIANGLSHFLIYDQSKSKFISPEQAKLEHEAGKKFESILITDQNFKPSDSLWILTADQDSYNPSIERILNPPVRGKIREVKPVENIFGINKKIHSFNTSQNTKLTYLGFNDKQVISNAFFNQPYSPIFLALSTKRSQRESLDTMLEREYNRIVRTENRRKFVVINTIQIGADQKSGWIAVRGENKAKTEWEEIQVEINIDSNSKAALSDGLIAAAVNLINKVFSETGFGTTPTTTELTSLLREDMNTANITIGKIKYKKGAVNDAANAAY